MALSSTTTLVLGATGATGSLLVRQLIEKNQNVNSGIEIYFCMLKFSKDEN